MSWSLKLGRVAGIPIYVHWTFWILILYALWSSYAPERDLSQGLRGVALMMALFGCVALHELGHALAALRYGIRTHDITLLPIGGVARLERMPSDPKQEFVVALAGPAVNVAIAAVLWPFVHGSASWSEADRVVNENPFLTNLFAANVMLVLFNLLPAFPMDGGRVLRALLAMALPYARATRVAATIGQVMAILFALVGLTQGQPMLLLVAFFVWIGAEGEARQVEQQEMIGDLPARAGMLTEYHVLPASGTLADAASALLAGAQVDFPVSEGGQVVGVLSRDKLMAGLAGIGRDGLIRDAMRPGIGHVDLREPLLDAMARLREGGEGPCLMVTDRGLTVGLLTVENIAELLMIRAALARNRARRP